MKKFLLAFICLALVGQELMGMEKEGGSKEKKNDKEKEKDFSKQKQNYFNQQKQRLEEEQKQRLEKEKKRLEHPINKEIKDWNIEWEKKQKEKEEKERLEKEKRLEEENIKEKEEDCNEKRPHEKLYKYWKLKNNLYDDKYPFNGYENFIKVRNQVIAEELASDEREIITREQKDLIDQYAKDQDESNRDKNNFNLNQDKPAKTNFRHDLINRAFQVESDDLIKDRYAKSKGYKDYNQLVGKEHAEQQFYAQQHNDSLKEEHAKSKKFKNHNHLVGKEHAEQQFHAQEEFKKLKRENRTLETVFNEIGDGVFEKTIDLTTTVLSEQLASRLIIPLIRRIFFPQEIKQEQEQQFLNQCVSLEAAYVKALKNTAHTFTQHNRRAIEQYNDLNNFFSHVEVKKEFEKDLSALMEELQLGKNKRMIQSKMQRLFEKYRIRQEDLALFKLSQQIKNDLPVNIVKEMEYNAKLLYLNEIQLKEAAQNYAQAFESYNNYQK